MSVFAEWIFSGLNKIQQENILFILYFEIFYLVLHRSFSRGRVSILKTIDSDKKDI